MELEHFSTCHPSYLIELMYSDICYLHDFIMKLKVLLLTVGKQFRNNIECVCGVFFFQDIIKYGLI